MCFNALSIPTHIVQIRCYADMTDSVSPSRVATNAGSGNDMPDHMIADAAIAKMHKLASKQRQSIANRHNNDNDNDDDDKANLNANAEPFFMAVGFHKPHLPHIAPQEFFDLYPLENVSLPDDESRHAPQDAPGMVMHRWCCKHWHWHWPWHWPWHWH